MSRSMRMLHFPRGEHFSFAGGTDDDVNVEEFAPEPNSTATTEAHEEEERKAREKIRMKHTCASENTTPDGKRPEFASERIYFIPEQGRFLNGRIDRAHYARLYAAIVAQVACNPGIADTELVDHFWGHSACFVRGLLQAMMTDGTLRGLLAGQPPARLLICPAQPRTMHYFLGPSAHSLATYDHVHSAL